MTKKLKLISVVLLFALMCVSIGANIYQSSAEQFKYSQRGWEAKEENGKPIIWTVHADGPAAALLVGDEVVSLSPSFVCAIVRHQVIPVSLIIRRSARYVLVSRGAILLDVIAVGLSVAAVLTYIFNRIRSPVIVIGLVSAAVGVVTWKVAGGLHTRYLRPLIDRRFFRQSYDAHQIITELTGELRTVTGLHQLLELVATKVQTALQTVNVTIFLRDQTTGNYRSAYSRDYSEADGRAISQERHSMLPYSAGLLKQLSDNGEPLEIGRHFSGSQQGSDNGKLRDAENDAPINPISSIGPIDPISLIHPINKRGMKADDRCLRRRGGRAEQR